MEMDLPETIERPLFLPVNAADFMLPLEIIGEPTSTYDPATRMWHITIPVRISAPSTSPPPPKPED